MIEELTIERVRELKSEIEYHKKKMESIFDEIGFVYNEYRYLGKAKRKGYHIIEYDDLEYIISSKQLIIIEYIKSKKESSNYRFNSTNLMKEINLRENVEFSDYFHEYFRYQKELFPKLFVKLDNAGNYRMNIK